ncbi:MAG: BlaI/MecI/CopY family transcriptional regulator [Verrucomicrobiales bacterium]|nr:BlaI/MecI/CopY family transcriptional regulator [Verrucomicrobiales bacterium]
MAKELPPISKAEWEVMIILWDAEEPLGLAEIVELLPNDQSRNPKTINTYLTRLTSKDVVTVLKIGRTNLYSANVDRKVCLKDLTRDLLRRVFRGATAPMMASLIEDADLSESEIDRLQEILDRKKGEKS